MESLKRPETFKTNQKKQTSCSFIVAQAQALPMPYCSFHHLMNASSMNVSSCFRFLDMTPAFKVS